MAEPESFRSADVKGEYMLSLTYTQTALKVEQESVRAHLNSFRSFFREKCKGNIDWNSGIAEQLLHRIKHLHLNCSWRRLEAFVLPEVRNATRSADLLLAELESLRLLGLDFYRSIRDQLRKVIRGEVADARQLYWSMELYCQTLLGLLAKEEHELFGVAFESVPEERWFSIAERFMQQDKEMLECGIGAVVHSRQLERMLHPSPRPVPALDSTVANVYQHLSEAVVLLDGCGHALHEATACGSANSLAQGAYRAI